MIRFLLMSLSVWHRHCSRVSLSCRGEWGAEAILFGLNSLTVSKGRRLRDGRCKDIDHNGGHDGEREGLKGECVAIRVLSIDGAELGFLVEDRKSVV